MPQVMTTKATVLCPHGDRGQTTVFEPTWMVKAGSCWPRVTAD